MSGREPIVAVGFFTARDLEILGTGFHRLFPVQQDDVFADLIGKLDTIEATPHTDGVLLRPRSDRG